MINDEIAAKAMSYLGQTEIQPNLGFNDPDYQAKIIATGWLKGEPWCAAAAIIDWTEAYEIYPDSPLGAKAKRLYSLGSQVMGNNFHADPIWPTSTTVPVVGSIVIYGDGDSTTSGHTGVVVGVDDDGITYHTVEGNTIPDGNPGDQREGYIVAQHTHKVGTPHSITGLNLIRFIHPMDPSAGDGSTTTP